MNITKKAYRKPYKKETLSNCADIPYYNIHNKLIEELDPAIINTWSLEYVIASFTKLLKIREKCYDKNAEVRKYEDEIRSVAENIALAYRFVRDNSVDKLFIKADSYISELGEALCGLGYRVRDVVAEMKYRGSVGVSSGFGKLLFEWGLSFDPYLNLPYIPASSIKGAVRSMYTQLCIKYSGDKNACGKRADTLFGSSDEGASLIMFTDAYPIQCTDKSGFLLRPDVITPHYNDPSIKYEKDARPNPIVYLSINKGVRFRFLMYYLESRSDRRIDYDNDLSRDPESIKNIDDLKLLDKAMLLAFGLGLGAKTLTGYSHFKIVRYKSMCKR